MKDIPLRHVMYSSVKNILLTVIMTTAVLAMQASSIEERDAIRAARGLLMMQESSLPIAQTPLIEKHKSSTRKRKIEGDVPVQLTLKSTSDAAVIAELNNPAIKKPRIKAIFLRYLKAANHEILDLVLQRENGKLIKHHVADALVEEFCGARQDRKIIALLRSHITPIGLIELVRETDLEINGVLGNIWLADQRDLSSVLRMCPPYCSPELWNRTDKERLQQQLAGLIKRREAFQVVKEE